jgi:hypothetical protein
MVQLLAAVIAAVLFKWLLDEQLVETSVLQVQESTA